MIGGELRFGRTRLVIKLYVKNIKKKFSKDEVFQCYSLKLTQFLHDKKIMHIGRGTNPNNQKQYYTFLKSPELQMALDEWKSNNPNNR